MKIRSKLSIALLTALTCTLAAGAAGPSASGPPRLSCARPAALKLARFEDGSAQLRCGSRLLARISSPG
jgi:hypothetical protein